MSSRKILILGADGFPSDVISYAWDRLPADLNVADFDVVLMNMMAFEDDEDLRAGIQLDRLPSTDQFARLILSQSELIAIGSLTTTLGDSSKRKERILGGVPAFSINERPVTWWCPVDLATVRSNGDVRDVHYSWSEYLDLVKRYTWHFDHLESGLYKPTYSLQAAHPEADQLYMEPQALASTRFKKAVAVELRFNGVRTKGIYEPTRVAYGGSAVLLPRPTECSVEEAIDLMLQTRYEIAQADRVPDWIDDFQLPNEAEPREKMTEQEERITQALRVLEDAKERAEDEGRFRKLLYETGEDVLEPVVRDALRELGASVVDPVVKGREDGRLEWPPEKRGMLEIKGRKGALRVSDVRELDHWVRDALVEWPSKGILIACLGKEDRPGQRANLFPPNCVTLAERTGIALLTTTQLYEALRRHQLSELDVEAFFEQLFSTSGICDFPDVEDSG
jgi:nucleotide-binding universal stress UspA family protein